MAKNRHQVIPRVMCFVFTPDRKEVVFMRASQEKDWEGKFDPPGGHIEVGESVITTANREVIEETSLTPKETKLKGIVHVSNFFNKNIMLFLTTSIAEKKPLEVHREGIPGWISINKLDDIDLVEDVRPILNRLLKLDENEILVGTSEFDGKDGLVSLDIEIG